MSVLIKGMEMPTTCGDCPCARIFDGYTCMAAKRSFDKYPLENREDWCPFVPVPEPHGRLGDLDALNKKAVERSEKVGELVNVMDKVLCSYDIQTAPTLIQASEEAE